jgi:nitrogenase molybdenum-iron protein beta chain
MIKKELNFKDIPSPIVVFESDSFKIWDSIKDENPDFIFGSSLDNDFAKEINSCNLTLSFPATDMVVIRKCYAGYNGVINLLEDTFTQLVTHS